MSTCGLNPPSGLCSVGVPEASFLGLTSCLYRKLSTMSLEGEGQGWPVYQKRLSTAEKVVQAAEAKANGVLIKEEKVEMGRVSRVNEEGWRGWVGPQNSWGSQEFSVPHCHGHIGEAEHVLGLCQGYGALYHTSHLSTVRGSKRSCHWGQHVAQCLDQ